MESADTISIQQDSISMLNENGKKEENGSHRPVLDNHQISPQPTKMQSDQPCELKCENLNETSEVEVRKPKKRISMKLLDEESFEEPPNNHASEVLPKVEEKSVTPKRKISDDDFKQHSKSPSSGGERKKKREENSSKRKRKSLDDSDFESDEDFVPDLPKKSRKSSTGQKVKIEESPMKPAVVKGQPKKSEKASKTKDMKAEKKTKKESIPLKQEHTPTKKGQVEKKEDLDKKEGKKRVKKEEEIEKWEWWKEEPHPDGALWLSLEHNGPYFPPEYQPMPASVRFFYDGKAVKLSTSAEEVATFYAKMLDHEYLSKDIFNKNFFHAWRKVMNSDEKALIADLKKCDFKEMHQYFTRLSEEKKAMTKEQKDLIKEENAKIAEQYGSCVVDGHKQKVGNFRIEPPGLFRGRGDHPKQGKLKLRVQPEEVTINIGEGSKVPVPPPGHTWKSVQHDNKVSWLASWVENISGTHKYVMLNPTAKIKGEKDMAKFDIARKLRNHIDVIRGNYKKDWESEDLNVAQRAVCLYFIDKLALRAGHEKEEGDSADTVGCCSLRVEHIKLHKELEDQKYVVEFDFLGKDSIRYVNRVSVKKKVFRNLKKFQQNKKPGTDLFDKLTSTSLNKYLSELMPGLTAKVFRTYNASSTLQEQLQSLTDPKQSVNEKMLSYNRANRAVAILCNHQRSVPKTFNKTMENLTAKIAEKKKDIKEVKKELAEMKSDGKSIPAAIEKAENKLKRLKEQLLKLNLMVTEKDENKTVALGTSKLNYLDPRITIAWFGHTLELISHCCFNLGAKNLMYQSKRFLPKLTAQSSNGPSTWRMRISFFKNVYNTKLVLDEKD